MSEIDNHTQFLKRTFALAKQASDEGNRPFGALLVVDDKIVLEARNSVASDNDITAHAEMNLIRLSWQHLDKSLLSKAVLYTSTEPCLMCAGAIANTPIRRVVYGCQATNMHRYAKLESPILTGREVLHSCGTSMQIDGPLLEYEALIVHQHHPW